MLKWYRAICHASFRIYRYDRNNICEGEILIKADVILFTLISTNKFLIRREIGVWSVKLEEGVALDLRNIVYWVSAINKLEFCSFLVVEVT